MFDKTADLYDLFYDFKDYAAEADAVRAIVSARHPRARTLLDVAKVEHDPEGLTGRGLWIGRPRR